MHPAAGHRAGAVGMGTPGTELYLEEVPWEQDEELSPQHHKPLWLDGAPPFLKHCRLGVPQKRRPTQKIEHFPQRSQLGKFSGSSSTKELLKTGVTQSYEPAGSLKQALCSRNAYKRRTQDLSLLQNSSLMFAHSQPN